MKRYVAAHKVRLAAAILPLFANVGATLDPITTTGSQTVADTAAGSGNVILIHPDGTGLSHWNAARVYWKGPDELLGWDKLPDMTVYPRHLADQLPATPNGGATVHAFGHKGQGSDSYGKDGGRPIVVLPGFPGSVKRLGSPPISFS